MVSRPVTVINTPKLINKKQMKTNFYLKPKNEAHSEAIQKRLFELGHEWPINDKSIKHTNEKYLFARDAKIITWATDPPSNEDGLELVTLDDLYSDEFNEDDQDTKDRLIEVESNIKEINTLITKVNDTIGQIIREIKIVKK